MRMKPKSTVHNPRAVLYRRYTDLEESFRKHTLYMTKDNKFWLFGKELGLFQQYDGDIRGFDIVNAYNEDPDIMKIFVFRSIYYYYNMNFEQTDGKWEGCKEIATESPVISGTSQDDGVLKITYEIPKGVLVKAAQTIPVTIDDDGYKFHAKIAITNSFGETALYEGERDFDDNNPFDVELVQTIPSNGYEPNTIVAEYRVIAEE